MGPSEVRETGRRPSYEGFRQCRFSSSSWLFTIHRVTQCASHESATLLYIHDSFVRVVPLLGGDTNVWVLGNAAGKDNLPTGTLTVPAYGLVCRLYALRIEILKQVSFNGTWVTDLVAQVNCGATGTTVSSEVFTLKGTDITKLPNHLRDTTPLETLILDTNKTQADPEDLGKVEADSGQLTRDRRSGAATLDDFFRCHLTSQWGFAVWGGLLGLRGPPLSAHGPLVCGPLVCGPQVCGPQVCGPQVCGPQVCVPQVCSPQVCSPQACGLGSQEWSPQLLKHVAQHPKRANKKKVAALHPLLDHGGLPALLVQRIVIV
ncbi:hypothetical protein MTO96_016996 [Rhipicephalus appendiculatus]